MADSVSPHQVYAVAFALIDTDPVELIRAWNPAPLRRLDDGGLAWDSRFQFQGRLTQEILVPLGEVDGAPIYAFASRYREVTEQFNAGLPHFGVPVERLALDVKQLAADPWHPAAQQVTATDITAMGELSGVVLGVGATQVGVDYRCALQFESRLGNAGNVLRQAFSSLRDLVRRDPLPGRGGPGQKSRRDPMPLAA
ncbi:MAG TPA: hypothetical protein VHB73_03985 [Alphaproteobacteria bacterium]|nr:hypothetical protein [Alphaproteobacteria bacterium]